MLVSNKTLDKLKSKYTKKQFDTLIKFIKEKPEVCIFSGRKKSRQNVLIDIIILNRS